ncbi:hypothetical protein ACM61V_01415 [Sphingomonas sp. TX0543]|uniref:hypothetical protein n=1 Tax=unclassified Sphingomonas TaxID=196159 RepID=UPI00148508D9|nr:hypothetical protein [Sphingomonas sp. 3P27F8]
MRVAPMRPADDPQGARGDAREKIDEIPPPLKRRAAVHAALPPIRCEHVRASLTHVRSNPPRRA